MAGCQLLTGKLRQTIRTDQIAVAGPVFFAHGNFLSTHGAVQAGLLDRTVLKMLQNKGLLKK